MCFVFAKTGEAGKTRSHVTATAYRVDGTGASGKGTDAHSLDSQEKGKVEDSELVLISSLGAGKAERPHGFLGTCVVWRSLKPEFTVVTNCSESVL